MSIFEKYSGECNAVGLEYIGKSSRVKYSVVKCMVCGTVGEYYQSHIRRGQVRCKACHETKMVQECSSRGFEWLSKVDANRSLCRCLTCGHEDTFDQGAMRKGEVKCTHCYETKMKQECLAEGFEWLKKVDAKHSLCRCLVCGHEDTYRQSDMRVGKVKCSNCQLIKYKTSVKDGWAFINHFYNGRTTYVNLKHSCCDDLVKVHIGNFLKGEYGCPHCMHTHFDDPSYFYVIQVGSFIKLGISNRPDQRYTQYGLPDDATITEHLRIPLENKRDALVVESHAKQLVKDFKIPPDIAKQVFTKEGFNECYSLESLEYLLTI